MVASSGCGKLNKENDFSPIPRSRLIVRSHEIASGVPYGVSPSIPHTRATTLNLVLARGLLPFLSLPARV